MNSKYLVITALLAILVIPLVHADTEQGFTVTSVSLANILHPGQSASQTQWLITVVLNGGGQSLVGSLGNSTINYQGFTSAYPLQLSGSTNPEQAFYQIYNTNPTPIYSYSAQSEIGSLSTLLGVVTGATAAPNCPQSMQSGSYTGTYVSEKDFDTQGWLYGATIIDRVCIYQNIVGYEALISGTPNIQSSSTLLLTANGKQELLNISYSQQSATSPDGLVQANWVGSLVTGNAAPGGNLYVAISNPQQNTWNVQSASSYTAYSTGLSSTQSQLSPATYTPTSIPSTCFSIAQNITTLTPTNVGNCLLNNIVAPEFATNNQYAQTLLSSGVQIGNSQTQYTSNYNDQSAFVVTLNNNFVNNQEVTLRINGAFIGVVIPEGTPKIISATSSPFNSGNNGTIIVNVENVGTAQGSFYTSLSNCSGITTTSSTKYAVSPGQTQQINVPIYTSGATQTINEQCTVTVTDYNGGGSSSSIVNVQAKPANQCNPNTSLVEGDYICPCTNVNGVYQTATGNQCTSCPYGVIQNNGAYSCASKPTGGNVSTNGTSGTIIRPGTSQLVNYVVTQVVIPMATSVVVPAVCSQVGDPFGICSSVLDYLLSKI